MVGMSAATYRIDNKVRKECRVVIDDLATTEENMKACETEANVYLILGRHPRIANCLAIGPEKKYVELDFCTNGNLRSFMKQNSASIEKTHLKRWALQMVESIAYIHSRGVRHSDIRLDQWLLDGVLNSRLCDFNGSGYDDQPHLGLKGRKAISLESPSHYLPRDPEPDNTVESDLFALGSALYELETGRKPYEGLDYELIESYFQEQNFPAVDQLVFGPVIKGCWYGEFPFCRRHSSPE